MLRDRFLAMAEAEVAASSCFSISSADKKSAGGAELSCAFTIPENSKIELVKNSFSIHFSDHRFFYVFTSLELIFVTS